MSWQCPQCHRVFKNPNQWHSCDPTTVDSHFEHRPAWMRQVFDDLLERLSKVETIRVDAVKAGINLATSAHFGGIRTTRSAMDVGFVLRRSVSDSRVRRREWVGGDWTAHTVRITGPTEIDDQLLGWLYEAVAAKTTPMPTNYPEWTSLQAVDDQSYS